MTRIFSGKLDGETAVISGDDARHIALSLRMRTGENIILCKSGVDYLCELSEIKPENVVCKVLSSSPCEAEPCCPLG